MKKQFLRNINLQLFADNDEGNEEVTETEETIIDTDNDEEETSNSEDNPSQETEEDEDEEVKILKRKLSVMDKERALELGKINDLEAKIESQDSTLKELKTLLSKIAEGTTKTKRKPTKTSEEDIAEITSKEILLGQMNKLEQQIKDRDERDFIKTEVGKKPYVADTVAKLKIKTKNEYIRYILPIEENLKETEELKKRTSEMTTDRDILSEYGLTVSKVTDSKTAKRVQLADELGGSVIDSVLL